MEDETNAACIVATHNAADVLIEVARAAKAWQAAQAAIKDSQVAWNDAAFVAVTSEAEMLTRERELRRAEIAEHDAIANEVTCRDAFYAAMAKVTLG